VIALSEMIDMGLHRKANSSQNFSAISAQFRDCIRTPDVQVLFAATPSSRNCTLMEFHAQAASINASGVDSPIPCINGLQIEYVSAKQLVRCLAGGSLILTLRHSVHLRSGDVALVIPKGGAYFIPAAQRTRINVGQSETQAAHALSQQFLQVQSPGIFLIMRASEVTWRALTEVFQHHCQSTVQPIAGLWPNANALARYVLQLMHRRLKGQISLLDTQDLWRLGHAFERALRDFEARAERCPGRGMPQKLQVFRRLMRVRQLMLWQCSQRLSIEQMAAYANYSRAHFLHIYRTVFAETPHAHLMEQRLHLAQHLLSERGLSVNETTLAAGFEDRSSFSKLFRRRFGRTAVSTRQKTMAR
jgi:AraC family transcriptional regulator